MVRISDARMSGTAYGTCVLHVAPESHVGGPLALVREGDEIELDVPNQAPGTQSGRERTIPSPRRVETPPTTLRPRLRGHLCQARDAGQ